MVVVRMELEVRSGKWNEAIALEKANHAEGGAWHNKTRGYRIYGSNWSGKNNRLVVEHMYESLAEWEAVRDEVFASLSDADWERYNEVYTDNNYFSYWTLEAEG